MGRKLADHWDADGMAAQSGNIEEDVRRFEEIHNVRLPPDLRDYLLFIERNGPDLYHGLPRSEWLLILASEQNKECWRGSASSP